MSDKVNHWGILAQYGTRKIKGLGKQEFINASKEKLKIKSAELTLAYFNAIGEPLVKKDENIKLSAEKFIKNIERKSLREQKTYAIIYNNVVKQKKKLQNNLNVQQR
ncbi:MAG: hypothetical protein ACOCP8_09655 [archaeon]